MENKMKINTRIFGEIEVEEDKIIHFVNGIVGFPELKEFALVFDEEKGDRGCSPFRNQTLQFQS